MKNIIIDSTTELGQRYPIQPKHISTETHLLYSFKNPKTEISAWWIIKLCRHKNGWVPFSYEEISDFSQQEFHFNGLSDWEDRKSKVNSVVLGGDKLYRVTHAFIAACFKSSPAI